jgi:membrane protein required for beta-lactamase induction
MYLWREIRSYLPVIFWYLQVSLTLVTAIITVYIARYQRKANRQRLTLDLYERRLKVFEAVREILGMMYTTVSGDGKSYSLLSQTRGAGFIFASGIQDYIESVWRHATTLSDTNKQLKEILGTATSETRKRLCEFLKNP